MGVRQAGRGLLALCLTASAALAYGALSGRDRTGASTGFADCGEFTDYVREVGSAHVRPEGFYDPNDQRRWSDVPADADGVLVDGTRLLMLTSRPNKTGPTSLSVLDTAGGRPVLRGTVTFPARSDPRAMLLLDRHRVLVLDRTDVGGPRTGPPIAAPPPQVEGRPIPAAPVLPPYFGTPAVVLRLVDTADPAHPVVLGAQRITGTVASAVAQDGIARLVLVHEPRLAFTQRPQVGIYRDQPEVLEPAVAHNRAVVAASTEKEWLPVRSSLDSAGTVTGESPLLGCADVGRPPGPTGPGLVSVVTLDAAAPDPFATERAVGVVDDDAAVARSTADRVYLARPDGAPFDGAPFDVPHADGLPAAPPPERTTTIHAFDVAGPAGRAYRGTATVDGYALEPLALSGGGGYLRVATSTGQPFEGAGSGGATVTVLAERDDGLQQVGFVTGIAPGKRVRAIRWTENQAAISASGSGGQSLALIDLTDPAAPRAVGEVTGAGSAGTLDPASDDTLVSVGLAGPDDGRPHARRVSSYGIADPGAPSRADLLDLGPGTVGGGRGTTAYAWLPGRRLLAVPAEVAGPSTVTTSADGTAVKTAPEELVIGVTVDAAGRLRRSGVFRTSSGLLRVLAVGDRLVAVTGAAVVVLDPAGLRTLGSLDVSAGNWQYS